MKKIFLICACMLSVAGVHAQDVESLRQDFLTPLVGGGAQTWWHWTSLFVTKQGITADLEAMKAIGYEAAHIFSTTSSPNPPGRYPEILSDEWLGLIHHAGREAQRLGISLGVHNCPGWSLSGGPWIKPEVAMQMLVSSETCISAPVHGKIVLPAPESRNGYYRDIAVLAFPDVNRHDLPELTADFKVDSITNLLDRNYNTYIRLPIRKPDSQAVITLQYDKPDSPQFIELSFGDVHLFVRGTIEASPDGVHYREAAVFDYRVRTDLGMPKYIRLNENARNACFFRVTFQYRPYRAWMAPANVRLNEIQLLASSMVTDVDSRNSAMEDAYSYKPFEADYTTPGIDPSQVVDLTDKLRPDGTLDWQAPAGAWTILRIGHTPTGKTNGPTHYTGLECDKMSRRGLNAHWPGMMGKIIDTLKNTGALKYAIVDSYEAGGQNWTPGFDGEFAKRRGYALKPYLPAVIGFVVGTPQQSARFLYDFQRTISELFAENYYDYFTELCHKNGLLAITEAYFGPYDYQRAARAADIPTSEFWVGSPNSASRMPASVGHFHGQKRVAAESFTSDAMPGRWQQDPKQFKEFGDRAWIQGISQLVMHSFVHQPLLNVRPGWSLGGNGTHINRSNTWWPYGGDWVKYINRSQYLLQAGLPVAELLVLSGESSPNRFPVDLKLLEAGYSYDFCCVYDLYDYAKVVDGRIVAPSGATYDALWLGRDKYLTLKTLEKVYELLQAGARVIGIRPEGSPSLSDDEAVYRAMVEKIWGNLGTDEVRTIGKGQLANSAGNLEGIDALSIQPDVKRATKGAKFLHRRQGDVDIYFVYNDTSEPYAESIGFRVPEGRMPERWVADADRMESAAVWHREGDYAFVPLSLAPRGSCFMVFRPGSALHLQKLAISPEAPGSEPAVSTQVRSGKIELVFSQPARVLVTKQNGNTQTVTARPPDPLDLSRDWDVTFPPDLDAPASIQLDVLASLSEHPDEGVRYFAGTATYRRSFALPAGWKGNQRRVVLDLGVVRNLAEVKVNGKRVGLLWKDPFSADITDYLRPGNNDLEIALTTLWPNRLIGDARNTTPVPTTDSWPDWVLADQPNSGQGHYTFTHWKGWQAEEELLPSGLIGPVSLRCEEIRVVTP